MKEVKVTTNKCSLLIIDDNDWDGCVDTYVGMIHNGFERLGHYKELTSDVWETIVDSVYPSFMSDQFFKDYVNEGKLLESSIDSGISLLTSIGFILEIPFKSHPDWREYASTSQYHQHVDIYHDYQNQLWINPIFYIKK